MGKRASSEEEGRVQGTFWRAGGTGRLLSGLLSIGVLSAAACSSAEEPAPRLEHNVLLITLDTTRADRLGCYGHTASTSPRMDQLAERGVRFENAIAQVPLTLPSHTSLMTGTYPVSNGVRVNDVGGLGSELPTLAELLRKRGLRTGAFIACWELDSRFGLGRGFDHYDDDMPVGADGLDVAAQRSGAVVCDRALAWLGSKPDQPFFAWVHFFDPHAPYDTAAPDGRSFDDPYDAEIAFVDAQVGRLLDWLDAAGKVDNTLVAVVGDHGEAFGDRGEDEHGLLLYASTLRVPFILSDPTRLPKGRTVEKPVGVVDLMPTLLDVLGIGGPASVQGDSYANAWSGATAPRSFVYSESEYARRSFGWASLKSLTTDHWKYIHGPAPELYDMRAARGDADDAADVAGEHPEVVAEMAAQLERLVAGMPVREAASVTLDSDALARMASLGYVAGAEAEDDDGRVRKNPREMIPVVIAFKEGKVRSERGDHAGAVALLEPAVAKSPESSELHGVLANAYYNLGRAAEAQREFELSLRSMADIPWKWCGLGDSLRLQNKLADATAAYRRAIEIDANCGPAHSRLGVALAEQGDFRGAERHHRNNLELNPRSAIAHTNLAGVLPALGKVNEALGMLRDCMREFPEHAQAYRAQRQILIDLGRPAEAMESLRAGVRALPRDPALALELAWALATSKDPALRNGTEALALAHRVQASSPGNPLCADVYAAAAAETGDFATAVASARAALDAAQRARMGTLAQAIARRLEGYSAGRPHRE
ncbi:MAG: sulfatase-like hydrolase/transferase [Planctomycetota bacterium]